MTNESNAENQAKAQAESIAQMVAALECDYDELTLLDASDGTITDYHDGGAEQLAKLRDAAGNCESEDEARERIQEDPLEVTVRSGWQSSGEDLEPAEFNILLCTGGPAVRIIGELDDDMQPTRAWIEYQDWGTPWTHLYPMPIEHETLLTYCREFFPGE
jgi:hypothetical protein